MYLTGMNGPFFPTTSSQDHTPNAPASRYGWINRNSDWFPQLIPQPRSTKAHRLARATPQPRVGMPCRSIRLFQMDTPKVSKLHVTPEYPKCWNPIVSS